MRPGPPVYWQSSPAVVNGVVYIGNDNANVYAFDAATGAAKWSFKTEGKVRSSPAVVNGVIYVQSGDEKVYAIDAATGTARWSFKLKRGWGEILHLRSSTASSM